MTNMFTYMTDRDNVDYDKICKVRSLVDECRSKFRSGYNLGKILTIDEMILRYKGKYCTIQQYLPATPIKWGIKL